MTQARAFAIGLALTLAGCGTGVAQVHVKAHTAPSTTTTTTSTTTTVPPTTTTAPAPVPPAPVDTPVDPPPPAPAAPAPAPASRPLPSITLALTTPTTPLTFGWVMIDAWTSWGVQIGPKVDGSGTHIAVYAWRACSGFASTGQCEWSFFQEYDALDPGSVHEYAISWGGCGWQLSADGRTLAVLDVGPDGGHAESDTGERTTS